MMVTCVELHGFRGLSVLRFIYFLLFIFFGGDRNGFVYYSGQELMVGPQHCCKYVGVLTGVSLKVMWKW